MSTDGQNQMWQSFAARPLERHANIDIKVIVPTTHRHLQAHPETAKEIRRILTLQLDDGAIASTTPTRSHR